MRKVTHTVEQRLLNRTTEELECRPGMIIPCWNCSYTLGGGGYPQIFVNKENLLVHRVAYQLWIGEIYNDLYVCHKCDNHICINPEHLWLGTQSDNIQDMVKKGRQSRVGNRGSDKARGDNHWTKFHPEKIHKGDKHSEITKGERNGNSKITEKDVREILLYKKNGYKFCEIKKILKLPHRAAEGVFYRESWKHVEL